MVLRKDHRLLLAIQEVKNLGQEMDTYVNIRVLKKPEKLVQESEAAITPVGTGKRDSVNSISKRKTLPPLPAGEEEDLIFRTSTVWKSESPFFGDDFEINLGDFHVVLIELYQKKILKDQHLGTITLDKDTLVADNTVHEDWNAIDGDKANKPSIRFKYIYLNESILPLHDYGNLMNLLFEDSFWLIKCMDRTAEDREEVAKVMVRISVSCENDVKLLSYLLKHDVEKTLSANVLFRANSIASKALDYYMKLTAMNVMRNALEPVVKEIMLQNRSCEIDFTRLESKEKYEENFTVLEAYIRWTVDRIFASLKEWPTNLRIILGNLRETVVEKWPDHDLVKYYCISGFLFLRLFSAAMLGTFN
eukprot:NODE_536_length_7014_cov_0.311208.p1 type:complete len:362 gc:universal NODE_536_length_7014_cov_0.311208:3742-4827(+)